MHINNWCDFNSSSPLTETEFRSRVAADAGTTVETLNSNSAFASKLVKLTLDEWKTFWSKHTEQYDSDAEVMTGLTAEYLPETKSVRLTLPTAVAKRLNTRWDAPYRSIFGLTEDSSYPGPFDDLQAGTKIYPFYFGTLPILERGKLPGPDEPEEPDAPYRDLFEVWINDTPKVIGDTIRHLASCDEESVLFDLVTAQYCTALILVDGKSIDVGTPFDLKPGMNRFTIRVLSTAADKPSTDYPVEIVKPLDVIRPYYDRILAVNLNPATNGGFTFSAFQWQKNGANIDGETGAYLYLSDAFFATDECTVTLTTDDGQILPACSKPGQLPAPGSESALKAYPNPAQSSLTIENTEWKSASVITLYNKTGAKVRIYPVTGFQTEINVSGYPSGTYILQSGNKSTTIILK
jgi:hypothetical protein